MAELKEQNPKIFEKKRPFDLEINLEDMSVELAEAIAKLAPFGNQNPKPLFCVRNVEISEVRYMGDLGQHVRFKISKEGKCVTCVLFGNARDYAEILERDRYAAAIAGSLDCQVWQGTKRLQLMVSWIRGGR